MTYRLITCPETAHLELVDYVDDPLGMLVTACSQFRPACAVDCPRTCAARLDRGVREPTSWHERGEETAPHDLGADDTFVSALGAGPVVG